MSSESKKFEEISNRLHNHQTMSSFTRKSAAKSVNSLDNFLVASYDHEKDLFVSKFKVLEHLIESKPVDPIEELRRKRISYIGHELVMGNSAESSLNK